MSRQSLSAALPDFCSKKGIPDSMGDSVMKAMALCVLYIGDQRFSGR